jgi:putative AlgH/UPF0301 family transcriptional regulator
MQINYDFFGTDQNLTPQKGRILISEPFLLDNYFKRSIVLITEHSKEGTVGFVLNKPVSIKINEVIADFPETNAIIYTPLGTSSLTVSGYSKTYTGRATLILSNG